MTKRHAKPTAQALAERSYRHVLAFKRTLLNQMAHIRLDIAAARREDRHTIDEKLKEIYDYLAENDRHLGIQERTLRTHVLALTNHCARLLREKETLQRQLAIEVGKSYKVVEDSEMTIHSHPPGMSCTDGCRTFQTRPKL